MEVDFEQFKDRYREELQQAVAFSGQDVDFFTEAKADRLIDVAARYFGDLSRLKVLDVGSGIGLADRFLTPAFGCLHGVDVAEGIVANARVANPGVKYEVYDGTRLPFSDASFDLVFTICLLHCLTPEKWSALLSEMARVTRNGGLVVIFEHNPLNPLTRYVARRCVLAGAGLLFGMKKAKRLLENSGLVPFEQRYILFFPWRRNIFRKIEGIMGNLPLGAQYYVAARK